MGNIARGGQTSGLPRYLEGARYSAQWAGMPYSVYGGYEGKNDMNDDINARSRNTEGLLTIDGRKIKIINEDRLKKISQIG